MPEDSKPNPKQQKKPYVKPELKKIPLAPEEACLGYCKTSSAAGPLGACTGPTPCHNPES
jgi:hypothetical protein